MARDTFQIRFDKHGHVVVDDEELQRRLLYLLAHDGQLVLRLKETGTIQGSELPVLRICPGPTPDGPIPRVSTCPNLMCVCGALKVVDAQVFDEQWVDLRDPRMH